MLAAVVAAAKITHCLAVVADISPTAAKIRG